MSIGHFFKIFSAFTCEFSSDFLGLFLVNTLENLSCAFLVNILYVFSVVCPCKFSIFSRAISVNIVFCVCVCVCEWCVVCVCVCVIMTNL